MLQQLQFSVCALGQNWCAKWFHDLFNGDILAGELISSGAIAAVSKRLSSYQSLLLMSNLPNKTECSHANGLEVRVSDGGC